MSEQPPLVLREMERVLARLEPLIAERHAVLVGGQAVAFWAAYLSRPGLRIPIAATKDIDFEGARTVAQRAGSLMGAKVRVTKPGARTPLTGVVRFLDSAGYERRVDFLESPRGLTAKDVRETAIRVAVAHPEGPGEIFFWAMHPERSMESRIYNTIELRRTAPLSMEQLAASISCAREWSSVMLGDESLGIRKRQRAVLDVNERVFRKCRSDNSFQMVYRRHGVDPFEAVAVDERLPKAFLEKRYPQMTAALDQIRSR